MNKIKFHPYIYIYIYFRKKEFQPEIPKKSYHIKSLINPMLYNKARIKTQQLVSLTGIF